MIVAVLACAIPQAAAAETVPLPNGAASAGNLDANLAGISCPAAGGCAAAGWYYDTSGDSQALIEQQSGNSWTAVQVSLASLPSISSHPLQGFEDISCASAGNCVAVGSYLDAANDDQGLVDTEVGGTWSVSELPLGGLPNTSGNPEIDLNSVACPAAGACVAVGDYRDSAGHQQALIATDSGGTWVAHEADLTNFSTYSNPYGRLMSVACSSVGNCAAIGSYRDSGDATDALIETEVNGTWSTDQPDLSKIADATGTPGDGIDAVACPAGGGCAAVGYYRSTAGFDRPMLLTESGTAWAPAAAALLPANADPTHQNAELSSVSCPAPGGCTAVGNYLAASSTIGGEQPFAVTETAGKWASGAELDDPQGASGNARAYMLGVSCSNPGSCLAVGRYDDTSGDNDVLVARLSAGSWSTAGVQQPSLIGLFPIAYGTVSCTTAGYCAIAGATLSWTGSDDYIPFLLDGPAASTSPSASINGTSALVSWTAPTDDGGLPITGYTITATDQTAASRGGQSVTVGAVGSATMPALTQGDTYTFTITPTSLLGNGLPVSTAAVLVPIPPAPPAPPAPPVTKVSISTTQLTASLAGLLTPTGPASRLKKLAHTHGYTFTWTPLEAGTVTVRWYARIGTRRHHHRRLIGSGTTTTTTATATAVHVTLNRTGRRIVKTDRRLHHRLHVTATVSFTSGTTTVTATHTFTLH
jgi:hypothetical protein